jgi:internalin A
MNDALPTVSPNMKSLFSTKALSRILRLLVLTSLMARAQAQVVSIPDSGLNAAILAALGKTAGPLTAQDMLSLTNLGANSRGVRSLEGLGEAHNLATLSLEGNQLTSLALPAGLTNLTGLDLGSNPQLTNFSFLTGLPNLNYLGLADNQLTSLTLPAGLTNLGGLDLDSNPQLTNFSFLNDLTNLASISLSSDHLTDVSFLSGLTNLTGLYLSDNQLTNLTLPPGLSNLTELFINENNLTNVSFLGGLTNGLPNLATLDLSGNQGLTNFSFLSGLTNLTSLDLTDCLPSGNALTNFSFLSGMTRLAILSLGANWLTSFTLPAGLPSLNMLYLGPADLGVPTRQRHLHRGYRVQGLHQPHGSLFPG